jgi:hypothetical protein
MLRLVLSAVALAGVLATTHPAFADPVAATASEQAQPAAPAPVQPAPPAPVRASSADAPSQENAGFGKNIIFVGFGWG